MARHRFCSFCFAAGRQWKTLDFRRESNILTSHNVGTDLNLRRQEDPIESSNFRSCQWTRLVSSCQSYRRIIWNNERHKQPSCVGRFGRRHHIVCFGSAPDEIQKEINHHPRRFIIAAGSVFVWLYIFHRPVDISRGRTCCTACDGFCVCLHERRFKLGHRAVRARYSDYVSTEASNCSS
jgi:hypothetical protein